MNDLPSLLQNLILSDWVNWIAQDADGTWWGFEVQPLQSHNGWYENEIGRYIKIISEKPNPNWKDSLLPYSSKQISK